jgi:hypothetical protein
MWTNRTGMSKRKYYRQQSLKITTFVFLVLMVVICLRITYNIDNDGQQGSLIWEFGKATKDVFNDLINGYRNE